MIRTTVRITANHKGYFEFRICPKQSAEELVTQECLNQIQLQFHDGSTKFYIEPESKDYYPIIKLPSGLTCEHCVLQWSWRAGLLFVSAN